MAIVETDDLMEVINETDVIYWTRIQEERFDHEVEYNKIKDRFIMLPSVLAEARPDSISDAPSTRAKHEMGTRDDHDILDKDTSLHLF